VWLRWEKRG
jgi:hypothetical protein